MQPSLNTRSMIFTLFGDYIRHYGEEIWVGSLIRLLEEFGHNEQSVRAAVSRMRKQGWVLSRKEGNKSYYFLTERGVKRMEEAAVRIFKLKPQRWDGKWRIFTYTIPEVKRSLRDELRQELVWSGFGSITSSCWISPNPLEPQVYDLIDKYDIQPYVNFFIATYDGPHENEHLLAQGWDIEEINRRYDEFMRTYSQKYMIDKNNIKKGAMTDGQCFVERAVLVHEYRKFLFIDPGFPEELLPDQWLGDSAASLFSDYYKVLAEPANRFFETVFREGNEIGMRNESYDYLKHPLITDE